MGNLEIYENVRAVPKEAKKEIKGGRMSGKTDINPMWRIKALTEQFGPCGIGWYYKTVNKWLESHGEEIAAFVDIELYIKINDQWSMPIYGTGGSMFVAKEKNGLYVSDECYKMATTDAISVSCKQLGIGADVYWDADSTKYNKPADPPKETKLPAGKNPNDLKSKEEYLCEACKTPFKEFDWRDRHYTPKDAYEISKAKCGGKALCNKCKKEAGIL